MNIEQKSVMKELVLHKEFENMYMLLNTIHFFKEN